MIATAALPSITIRPAAAEDQAFVAATFAEQLERGGHKSPNAIVDRILDSDATRVLIALEHGRIVGWLAYAAIPRVRAVLFVYTRRQARTRGVARELVDAAWPEYAPGPRVMGGQLDVDVKAHRIAPYVHAALRGGSTRSLLQRFPATEMSLDDLL